MTKLLEIKFIPTGNTFKLPEEEVIRLVKEDRGNYVVVGDGKKIVEKALAEKVEEKPTTYSQVVVEEAEAPEVSEAPSNIENMVVADAEAPADAPAKFTKEELEAKTVVQLKELLNENRIAFSRSDNKDALVEKALTIV